MRVFENPLNQFLLENEDKTDEEPEIDVIDYEAVSYGKSGVDSRERLSSNAYKYEKILATNGFEEHTSGIPNSPEATLNKEKALSVQEVWRTKKPVLLIAFGLVFSIACVAMLAAGTFKVFENSEKGNILFICSVSLCFCSKIIVSYLTKYCH